MLINRSGDFDPLCPEIARTVAPVLRVSRAYSWLQSRQSQNSRASSHPPSTTSSGPAWICRASETPT